MSLVLARHGRTASNAAGLLLGRADVPLDDTGWEQARATGAALGPVDLVVTSPLRRATETASCIEGPSRIDERLIELDYGDLDRRPLAEVDAATWATWRADVEWSPPGGESLAVLGHRVRAAMEDLVAEATDGTVVVVSHVSPIKAAVAWVLGVGDEVAWRMFVAPGSISRVQVGPKVRSLLSFNETSHLGGPTAVLR